MHPRQRIELREHAADAEPAISGWAIYQPAANGLADFVLNHEYTDRKPAPGWSLSASGRIWNVVAADGKCLIAQEAF